MKRSVNGWLKKEVAAAAAWRCAACAQLVDHLYQIDHIVPLHLGGSNAALNLQLLCYTCHGKKTWTEARVGRLALHERHCWKCNQVWSTYFAHVCPAV